MKLTASNLAILPDCQWYARPEVIVPWEPSGPEAKFGSAVHAAAEMFIRTGLTFRDGDFAGNKRYEDFCSAVEAYISQHDVTGWTTEAPFAWSPSADTARRILSSRGARDYSSLTGNEIAGTADVVAVLPDRVQVLDWKTGKSPAESYEPQMNALCLFVARAYGLNRAEAIIVQIKRDGVVEHRRTLDAMALDAVACELSDQIARVPGSEPRDGPWCRSRYCKAIKICPAHHLNQGPTE